MSDLFRGYGIEVSFVHKDGFQIALETLSRMGLSSKKDKRLYQSCHVLHKRGEYAILHFKELFLLDNKEADITKEDIERRNLIVKLLEEWGIVKAKNDSYLDSGIANISSIKIVPYKEKHEWEFCQKYTIGTNKR